MTRFQKLLKKCISHPSRAQHSLSAAVTVQVSHALITILQCGNLQIANFSVLTGVSQTVVQMILSNINMFCPNLVSNLRHLLKFAIATDFFGFSQS
jgi:hypothetical protein